MNRTVLLPLLPFLLISASAVGCQQATTTVEPVHTVGPAATTRPQIVTGKSSPQQFHVIHNEAEARSDYQRFVEWQASQPSVHPDTAPSSSSGGGSSCGGGSSSGGGGNPPIVASGAFMIFCAGGANWSVQGCTSPGGCIYPDVYGDPSQQLPGTQTGVFTSGFTEQEGGYTGYIPPGTCVTANGAPWSEQNCFGGSPINTLLFPNVALDSVIWNSNGQPDINQALVTANWSLPSFSILTNNQNSIMDDAAIFEFVVSTYAAEPSGSPAQLYNLVSSDWDYNSTPQPGL